MTAALRLRWLIPVLLLAAGVAGAQDAPPPLPAQTLVTAIRFEGNDQTREEILRQEIQLREGTVATAAEIDKARQAIMDLGLFEWVRASVEEGPGGGRTVVFSMEEKFFFLPVPLLNGDPSKHEYSFGLEMRVDNLGGLNQRVRLKYEEEHSGSEETPFSRDFSVAYRYPRLRGTAYNLGLGYRLQQDDFNVIDDTTGDITAEYHRNVTTVSAGVSRWLDKKGPSRGWIGGMGLAYTEHDYGFLSGTPGPFETSHAVSVSANVSFDDVHDHGYYTTGSAYGWAGEIGTGLLGSDYDFTRHLFHLRVYDHFNPKLNLNWQLRIGFAAGKPFGNPAYSIGGFTTLRGYEDDIEGNALALSNLEYHHQLDEWPSLRGVWFLDVGNVYDRIEDMDPGDLEAGTGFGVRWRIQSLVDVTLSADLAYGIGTQTPVFYLMTSGTF